MRNFHSYGPVDCEQHFCVERRALVEQGLTQLIGHPQKGGHYFTIWAPRQTGKTWLIRQFKQEIPQQYGEQFTVFHFSFGNLRGMTDASVTDEKLVPEIFSDLLEYELPDRPQVTTWKDFLYLFAKKGGLWDRPLILLIDEADTAPPKLLDLIVGRFRELYLDQQTNWLHGLALVGVRAVLGVDSPRGSPFNIQKSMHVPNLTRDEVEEMYQQYQRESGQSIDPAIVETVYNSTRGQPGLVSWFGELLTDRYNPGPDKAINDDVWKLVWLKACFVEPNNTVMNLIAKARKVEYIGFLTELFAQANIPFSFDNLLHNHMYLNGIISTETVEQANGELVEICRFSSPFVQTRIYHALKDDLVNQTRIPLALEVGDDLADVFDPAKKQLDLPALLQRYKEYLVRLKAAGHNPWKEQPRRGTDLHLTEAVGHFHLYAWLKEAIGDSSIISPEFPTGNGKVDLLIRAGKRKGVIELKSFRNVTVLRKDQAKAAAYAKSLGRDNITMAIFVPVLDEEVLGKLSGVEMIDGVEVTVVAIGWV